MLGFGWQLRSRIKAFGPGWNAEILAELVSVRVEVPGAGGGRKSARGSGEALGGIQGVSRAEAWPAGSTHNPVAPNSVAPLGAGSFLWL